MPKLSGYPSTPKVAESTKPLRHMTHASPPVRNSPSARSSGGSDEVEPEDLRIDTYPPAVDRMPILHDPVIEKRSITEVRGESRSTARRYRSIPKQRARQPSEVPTRADDQSRERTFLIDPASVEARKNSKDVARCPNRPLVETVGGDTEPFRQVRKHDEPLGDPTDVDGRRRHARHQRFHIAVHGRAALSDVVPNDRIHRHILPERLRSLGSGRSSGAPSS
jgi:hypothetical protein